MAAEWAVQGFSGWRNATNSDFHNAAPSRKAAGGGSLSAIATPFDRSPALRPHGGGVLRDFDSWLCRQSLTPPLAEEAELEGNEYLHDFRHCTLHHLPPGAKRLFVCSYTSDPQGRRFPHVLPLSRELLVASTSLASWPPVRQWRTVEVCHPTAKASRPSRACRKKSTCLSRPPIPSRRTARHAAKNCFTLRSA